MPVQFQGATEYQRKFKAGQLRRSRSASPPHGKCRLAGLRSDQLAISREPQFLSKRKIPSQKPSVSRSLCWDTTSPSSQRQTLTSTSPQRQTSTSTSPQRRPLTSTSPQRRPLTSTSPQRGPLTSTSPQRGRLTSTSPHRQVVTSDLPQRPAGTPPPASAGWSPDPAPLLGPSSPDRPPTPLAPRKPKPSEMTTAPRSRLTPPPCTLIHQTQSSRPPLATVEDQQALGDGVQQVLRRKAGLRSWGHKAGLHRTEYDRQFLWKTPVARSPLLLAEQMHSKASRSYKPHPVALETEYRRCFKGSPPPRAPRSRHDPEHCKVPLFQQENVSPQEAAKKSKRKKKGEELGKSSLPEGPRQELRSHSPKQAVLPQEGQRKVKSEYNSNFHSPLNYRYKDGTWVKSSTVGEEACDIWYHEVRELRERAEAYRKRAWGTHFSRQHLNQILSEQTLLWEPSPPSTPSDPSTNSPSPIVQALDLARVSCSSSAAPSVVKSAASKKGPPATPPTPLDPPMLPGQGALAWGEKAVVDGEGDQAEERQETEEREEVEESEDDVASDSLSSREGRLPTPQLKFRPVQRTHHDLTTPATGGAILVSPPRQRKVCGWVSRVEPPLGKPHSPYKHLPPPPHRDTHQTEGRTPPCTSPTAGVITADPLPMREEAWSGESPRPDPLPTSKPVSRKSRPPQHQLIISPPANAIQGMLRNPEFQHNGDLGPRRSDLLLYSPADSDEDDRLSVMSWRSAASCSMASAVLERAQKRREDFWGKR